MERRSLSHSQSTGQAAANAIVEALRQPPLRVVMRHEPCDAIDGYPTIELTPCGAATAFRALDRAASGSHSTLLIDSAYAVTAGEAGLSNAMREGLIGCQLGASLLLDTASAIDIARAIGRRLTIARVDGPVDVSDARALETTISSGATPLDADLRTVAVVQAGGGRSVWAQFRDLAIAERFLGILLSQYVARVHDESMDAPAVTCQELMHLPRRGFVVRPRDIRAEGATVVVPVRNTSSRTTVTIAFDRSTGRWYA